MQGRNSSGSSICCEKHSRFRLPSLNVRDGEPRCASVSASRASQRLLLTIVRSAPVRPQRRVCIWTFLWWLRPAGRRTMTAALAPTPSRRAGPDQNVITPPSQCHAGQQNLTAASKWNALNELTSTGSSVAHTF